MVDGSPNSDTLSMIIENTAPTLRKMREILQEEDGTCIDLDELITALLELRNADHVLFGNWYPTLEAKYYRNQKFYEGYFASKVDLFF